MNVIGHSDQRWILLADGDRLLFDVNCSHSFFSYCFLMELNEVERRRYDEEGGDYLDRLADEIQDSAPGLLASKSKYKDRTIHSEMGEAVSVAFLKFRNEKQERI